MDLKDQLSQLFPDHEPSKEPVLQEEISQLQKEAVVCKYEKKGRNGKPVTLIENFLGSEKELKSLSKKIKNQLGIGGSQKDGIIIFQGDNREKIRDLLHEMGYKTKRVGG